MRGTGHSAVGLQRRSERPLDGWHRVSMTNHLEATVGDNLDNLIPQPGNARTRVDILHELGKVQVVDPDVIQQPREEGLVLVAVLHQLAQQLLIVCLDELDGSRDAAHILRRDQKARRGEKPRSRQ